ncbi:mechanosensitive ion channel family protein [Brachybacterium sp. AOP25-B2-12]|uniref:mechanosensitive ion channel family protein n=1 Tax=Brachybacterium sp. AOP25-B2-12 TaxID=3457710 RepID=UPI004034A8FE
MDLSWLFAEGGTGTAVSLLDRLMAWLTSSGVTIVLIVVVAAVARVVAGWLIKRFFRTMISSGSALSSMTNTMVRRDRRSMKAMKERREQRAETLSSVSKNVAALVIGVIAFVMILSEFNVNVGPIIASIGVVGLAAGIGAQTIIKDFVAGLVMLFEDIVAVGDVVDLEHATGTVVTVNLRVTQVRSLDGALWTVRNGEIVRIGNMSRGYSNAVVQLDIANAAHNAKVTEVLQKLVDAVWEDQDWHEVLLDRPSISGVLAVDGARYQRRIVAKVQPGQQWALEEDLRQRVRVAFSDAGIEFAMPRIVEPTAP